MLNSTGIIMGPNIDQGTIIDNLNKYLEWNNLPLRMNKTGVCNGLASVYAKYALAGNEKEFMDMLSYIAENKVPVIMESKVDIFVAEIILSYFPEEFNQKLNQTNSMQTLSINNKPLKSSFDLALATCDENWGEIIFNLKLNENEVMRVSSSKHVISIRKEQGVYIVYDPNYISGKKEFHNEQDLVNELHNNVFKYNNGLLGMSIQVIRNPESPERNFPSVTEIYSKYLNEENINDAAKYSNGNGIFTNIRQATATNHIEAINKLIEIGASDDSIAEATYTAVQHNCTDALASLLLCINEKNINVNIELLFDLALIFGRKECFDILLKNDKCKAKMEKSYTIETAILKAATGGNFGLLKQVYEMKLVSEEETPIEILFNNIHNIDKAPIQTTDKLDANKAIKDNISTALMSGSVKCVRFMLEKLEKTDLAPTETEKMQYLLLAIKENKSDIVDFLMDNVSKNSLQTIKMGSSAIEKTELNILKALQEKGVKFSKVEKAIIAQKEHKTAGVMLSIGIMLNKFTDYCRGMANKLTFCSKTSDEYRKKIQEIRVTTEQIKPEIIVEDIIINPNNI